MLREFLPRLVFLCLAFYGTLARGALLSIDDPVFGPGALTGDTATGLAWLDITSAGTRSFNDMTGVDGSNEFAPGGAFAGFRYATMAEVKTLWIDAGIPESAMFFGLDAEGHNIGTYQTNDASVFAAARTLQGLIGYELTTANPPYVNAGGWETKGLALDPGGIGFPRLETCTVGTGYCGGSSIPITQAHLDSVNATYWQPLQGYHHWLVEDGFVPAVPEPSTYAMLLAGLGLAGFVGRRRRQSSVAA